MQIHRFSAAALLLGSLSACASDRHAPPHFAFSSPQRAETEAYVRAIEAGMAHAERVQEMRRSAARRQWVP